MSKRRIAVITGTRAEYGLLRPVIQAIDEQPRLKLQLIVTGMHLVRRLGYTVRQITQDGLRIDARVRLQGEKDDIIGQSRGLGRAIKELTDTFSRLQSEVVLVLGDRLEMFAAAAATASHLVLAHIHGGDVAPGVQDDAYRHAISKLAHLHFAATAGSKQRLLRMGEDAFRIYQTGSPALDNFSKTICKDISVLNEWAGFDVCEDFLLVLQHPAGGTARQEEKHMADTLRACCRKDLQVLCLYPNCDPGYSGILRALKRWGKKSQIHAVKHVPRGVYLGLLKHARGLVGNSSSGIIEAGYLNVDVVNIGPRQAGRQRAAKVRDVDYCPDNIARAVGSLLKGKSRRAIRTAGIYGDGRSGRRIGRILARVKLDQRLRQKRIAY